mgnify:FL=1
MTAKATARALRVDIATVTKLVRHEIRDVPLQPERIPLHVVYEVSLFLFPYGQLV